MNTSTNSVRIAKNTVVLYIRMFIVLIISLFTSRVILASLGVSDYGIYNVVGGFVSMFTIFSSTFSASISRYITYEIGQGGQSLNEVFSSAVQSQVLISAIFIILAEVIGIWFLNAKMNIPAGRLKAANIVMQLSIASFVMGILSVPYNASIIAHEKMNAFAIISVIECFAKLFIAFIIKYSPFDRLIIYSSLLLFLSLIIRLVYVAYCKKNFNYCYYKKPENNRLLKEITSFAGWSFLSNTCYMFNTQGVNILMNVFFGVTVNAARGIATQVENAVLQFVNSFMTAINPQIIKSYSSGDLTYMHRLVCLGARFSYFMMLFFAIPICLEAPIILKLWLKTVPDYSVAFVRFTFLTSMTTVLGNTLLTAINATGDIKRYQIVVSLFGLLSFPLTWIAFKLGFSPISAYLVYFVVYFILIFVRIMIVKDKIQMNARRYFNEVLIPCGIVTITSAIFPLFLFVFQDPSIARLLLICLVSFASTGISIFLIGMSRNDREKMLSIIKTK